MLRSKKEISAQMITPSEESASVLPHLEVEEVLAALARTIVDTGRPVDPKFFVGLFAEHDTGASPDAKFMIFQLYLTQILCRRKNDFRVSRGDSHVDSEITDMDVARQKETIAAFPSSSPIASVVSPIGSAGVRKRMAGTPVTSSFSEKPAIPSPIRESDGSANPFSCAHSLAAPPIHPTTPGPHPVSSTSSTSTLPQPRSPPPSPSPAASAAVAFAPTLPPFLFSHSPSPSPRPRAPARVPPAHPPPPVSGAHTTPNALHPSQTPVAPPMSANIPPAAPLAAPSPTGLPPGVNGVRSFMARWHWRTPGSWCASTLPPPPGSWVHEDLRGDSHGRLESPHSPSGFRQLGARCPPLAERTWTASTGMVGLISSLLTALATTPYASSPGPWRPSGEWPWEGQGWGRA